MKKYDYYAGTPSWKMPKWVGASLGGVFTVIVVGCGWLIVDLTRPPRGPVVVASGRPYGAVDATAKVALPQKAAAAVPAVEASSVANIDVSSTNRIKKTTRARGKTLIAKHEPKSPTRPPKTDLDKLLGL